MTFEIKEAGLQMTYFSNMDGRFNLTVILGILERLKEPLL
jgi:hypothetical protein